MSELREQVYLQKQVFCDTDGELMQAHAVASTPNLHLKGVVYVSVLYRCTIIKCRRTKTITTEVVMPHP